MILRIRQLKQDLNYSIHPKVITKKALEHLLRREKSAVIKSELGDLLGNQ